jgi:hypothetical protein
MSSPTPPKSATCPRCNSSSIQAVPVERKKVGQAILAEYFMGTAAGVAAGSQTVIQAVCLSCGCQWFPGTRQEQSIRALSGQLGEKAMREEHQRIAHAKASSRRLDKVIWIAIVILVVIIVLVILFVPAAPVPPG